MQARGFRQPAYHQTPRWVRRQIRCHHMLVRSSPRQSEPCCGSQAARQGRHCRRRLARKCMTLARCYEEEAPRNQSRSRHLRHRYSPHSQVGQKRNHRAQQNEAEEHRTRRRNRHRHRPWHRQYEQL